MYEASIKNFKLKLEDLIKTLDAFFTEVERVEATEAHLKRKGDIILQKEKGFAKREAAITEKKSKIEVLNEEQKNLIKELEEKKQELKKVTEVFEKKKKDLIARGEILDAKIARLSKLKEVKKELDEREEELANEKAEIVKKDSLIKKERVLARKRKEALDVKEATLKTKQAKLQKFFDDV